MVYLLKCVLIFHMKNKIPNSIFTFFKSHCYYIQRQYKVNVYLNNLHILIFYYRKIKKHIKCHTGMPISNYIII